MVKLTVDIRELQDLQRRLFVVAGDLRKDAIAIALNKTGAKGKTEVDRAVRDTYSIPAERVRNAVSLRSATPRLDKLTVEIVILGSASKSGRSLNTIYFLEKKTTLGQAKKRAKAGRLYVQGKGGQLHPILRFQFKKGSGGKEIEGAFIGNKGRTIFRRLGKKRLPIEPVQVIDVQQMFNFTPIRERVMDRINTELPIEMSRAVAYVLSRLSK